FPAWDIQPDSTSTFVVADATWHAGATGTTSPVGFEVPNRSNATVHVLGKSANILGDECATALSPLTRWRIGGSGGVAQLDSDVPPAPVFGLAASGHGMVEVGGIGFSDLLNTRTVAAATLILHHVDELDPQLSALGADATDSDTTLTLAASMGLAIGDLLQIENEIVVVT